MPDQDDYRQFEIDRAACHDLDSWAAREVMQWKIGDHGHWTKPTGGVMHRENWRPSEDWNQLARVVRDVCDKHNYQFQAFDAMLEKRHGICTAAFALANLKPVAILADLRKAWEAR